MQLVGFPLFLVLKAQVVRKWVNMYIMHVLALTLL
jgi:hypothetical protein